MDFPVIRNYIGGEFVDAANGNSLPVVNPATGEEFTSLPDSGVKDVEHAVSAAGEASKDWGDTSPYNRAQVLLKIADLLEARTEEFALAESTDNGKPLSLARAVDIPRAVQNCRFYAAAIQQFTTHASVHADTGINYETRHPVGIAGCISPWNLPLYLFTWKVLPALAAGNAVVAKPSEVTPYTAYLFSRLCQEARLPEGVLNVVHGTGSSAGAAIVSHPDIPAISFTGGTATGRTIAATAAPMFKKLSLELGGKNPTIVFSDCNFKKTVRTAVRAAFANQGQICLCGSRILIEESIYPEFREAFLEECRKLTVGDPLEATTGVGAVVSRAHYQKILECIDGAVSEGGKILAGGSAVKLTGRCKNGVFIAPTVIEGLSAECETNKKEIFGPVVTLIPFSSEAEAVAAANCTPYGLAASIWTGQLDRAHRLAHNLQSGIVWINCWLMRDLTTPFGGMKQSGVGREGGMTSLEFFTESKNICLSIERGES